MNPGRGPNSDDRIPDADRVPDALIDALLDGELKGDARREAFQSLRGREDACEEVASTRAMLDALRQTAEPAPDLSGTILRKVNARRRFLTPKWRRIVRGGRLAVAAGVLMGIGLVATAQRIWPDATTFTPQPAPIATLVGSTVEDADAGVRTLAAAPTRLASAIGDELAPKRVLVASPGVETRVLSDDLVVADRVVAERVIDLAAAHEFFSSTTGSQWPAAACDVSLPRAVRSASSPRDDAQAYTIVVTAPASIPGGAFVPARSPLAPSVAGFGALPGFSASSVGFPQTRVRVVTGLPAPIGTLSDAVNRPGHRAAVRGVPVWVTSWRTPSAGGAKPSVAVQAVDVLP